LPQCAHVPSGGTARPAITGVCRSPPDMVRDRDRSDRDCSSETDGSAERRDRAHRAHRIERIERK